MKKIIPVSLLLLAGCGQNVVPGVNRKSLDPSATCPMALRQPREEITIFFSSIPPGRLAVDMAGQRKYSECAVLRGPPPVVRLERLPGNRLSLKFQRFEKRRAGEVLFSVKDLKDCSGNEEDLLKEEQIALHYVMEYPDGPKCPGQPTAKVELVR